MGDAVLRGCSMEFFGHSGQSCFPAVFFHISHPASLVITTAIGYSFSTSCRPRFSLGRCESSFGGEQREKALEPEKTHYIWEKALPARRRKSTPIGEDSLEVPWRKHAREDRNANRDLSRCGEKDGGQEGRSSTLTQVCGPFASSNSRSLNPRPSRGFFCGQAAGPNACRAFRGFGRFLLDPIAAIETIQQCLGAFHVPAGSQPFLDRVPGSSGAGRMNHAEAHREIGLRPLGHG